MRLMTPLTALPGASVLLPLAAGAALATAGVHPESLGPFAAGFSDDTLGFVAMLMVCVGAQISPRTIRPVATRIGVVLGAATVLTSTAVVGYAMLFGRAGLGGVSVVAVAAAAITTSNAVWLALARRYGTPEDAWGGSVASILNSAPALPLALLMLLGHHTGHALPWRSLLDALLPLTVGAIAGLLAPACRPVLHRAIPVLLIAVAFTLGLRIDLHPAAHQLPAGLALGAATGLASGGLVAAGWRLLLHQPGTVGWAAAASTVTVPLIPAIVAASDPSWTPYVGVATAQLGIALLVSTCAAPLLVAASAHRHAARLASARHGRHAALPEQATPERSRLAGLTTVDQSP